LTPSSNRLLKPYMTSYFHTALYNTSEASRTALESREDAEADAR